MRASKTHPTPAGHFAAQRDHFGDIRVTHVHSGLGVGTVAVRTLRDALAGLGRVEARVGAAALEALKGPQDMIRPPAIRQALIDAMRAEFPDAWTRN